MWKIYLIEQADMVKYLCLIAGIIIGFVACIAHIESKCDNVSNKMMTDKSRVVSYFISIALLFSGVVIPSTKSAYLIFGLGTTLDYLKQSDEAKKLPENTIKLINNSLEKLNEKLEEEQ